MNTSRALTYGTDKLAVSFYLRFGLDNLLPPKQGPFPLCFLLLLAKFRAAPRFCFSTPLFIAKCASIHGTGNVSIQASWCRLVCPPSCCGGLGLHPLLLKLPPALPCPLYYTPQFECAAAPQAKQRPHLGILLLSKILKRALPAFLPACLDWQDL